MPKSEKAESVAGRPSLLRRAGLPTVAAIIIAVVGAPGFWEFFDDTEDEAKVKAEVSYALLKAQAEGLAVQMQDTRQEVKDLRTLLTQLLLQRGAPKSAPLSEWPLMGSAMSGMSGMPGMPETPETPETTETPAMPPEPRPRATLAPLPANLDSAAAAALEKE